MRNGGKDWVACRRIGIPEYRGCPYPLY